ncbi:glycosyltransferase [Pseudodesulfovibrio sp. zrk46]|uniref:glycosyltransferase family 2 protein n=1 Tax=Pseudodesulfovibrio sp. zrk46 TaxID=2725288 RepID=UPI00144A0A1C|nr:glycosyltransferase [Pseudodesulfovibrio sp. zrk46]QJB55676.1 glycosyltransferase family 2 protein [Pseudodesulfovibrio sp. zrk46]
MSDANRPLTDFWESLPEELKAKLRLGFTGKQHLLDIAGGCLRSGVSALQPIAADALLNAFAENPLSGEMAAELMSHDAIRGIMPEPPTAAMDALAANWQCPANTSYLERLLQQRNMGKLKHFIEQSAAKEPGNLFWREQAVTFGLIDNDIEWVASMLDFTPPEGMAPLIANVHVRLDFLRGKCSDAARLAHDLGDTFGPVYPGMTAGLCMLNDSDPASANLLLLQSLAKAPWNTSLLLRVHDLLTGRDNDRRPINGSVAILLYSWNKAIELDATLRSLYESELSGASLFVLDNGSTDTTPKMLESWQGRFTNLLGEDRFQIISLPVNVGAPAARNWLMHHPPVGSHDFICYLDDDVELPADWLLKLGAAIRHYPDAGVWGCKVLDDANTALIQSADSHLQVSPDAPPLDLTATDPNPFRLSNLHVQTMDSGLFDHLRPCASVTGCCHIFRTEGLMESGDFAIHLSPTQYDDMEHDLRLCKESLFPVYQGHLGIRHKKRTGMASHTSMQEEGNALGNKYKMQTMHTHEELLEAAQKEQKVLDDDLLTKIKVVEQVLAG